MSMHHRHTARRALLVGHRVAEVVLAGLMLVQGAAALAPAQAQAQTHSLSSTAPSPQQPGAPASTPTRAATMTQEVDALLAAVTRSGCDFQRNGSWHDARAAEAHLRDKFNYLHDKIHSAEDFIELAATRSAVTGTPYAMRCAGQSISTHQWLSDRLVALRSAR